VIYTLVFGSGIFYVLTMMAKLPERDEPPPRTDEPLRSHGLIGGQPPINPSPAA
jgi:hypothetical protein